MSYKPGRMTDLATRLRLLGATTALVAVALVTPASAQARYRQSGLLHTGFSDKRVATDVWTVKGSSGERNGSVSVALYRAAEIASAVGVDTIRIVRQKIKQTTVTTRYGQSIVGYSERAQVTFRAVRNETDRSACEMPDVSQCLTLQVAGLLSRYGPEIGMPAARPGESPAAPAPIALRSEMSDAFVKFAAQRGYTTPAYSYPAAPRPVPAALPARIAPRAAPIAPSRTRAAAPSAETIFAQRLAAAQPIKDRDPVQGWTISN